MCRSAATPSRVVSLSTSPRLDPEDVVDLDVEWPASELIDTTIIDTPGTSSLSRDVSQRTLRLLVPDDGVPRVDAVVFLLRTLNAADIALLMQIGELVGGSAGALGVIGVASRADEIGAGRIDAMLSAKDVAARFTSEMDKTGHLPGGGAGVGAARADRTHAAAERVRRAGEAGRGRRDRADQGDAVGGPIRPRGQFAAGRRRHPGRVARPVRHVRDQDLDRRAARGSQRFGGTGRRTVGAQRVDRAARCDRSAVRAAFGSTQGAHRAALAAALRGEQPHLRDAVTSSPTSTRCWPTPTRSRSCGCSANCVLGQRH